MTTLEKCPVLGLDDDVPGDGYVVARPSDGKHLILCLAGVHGLAYFEDECDAEQGCGLMPGTHAEPSTFDQARAIAKTKPAPIVAVHVVSSTKPHRTVYFK